MIDIPHRIADEIFEREFVRGSILSTSWQFGHSVKTKYLIVLNREPKDMDILLFMTTSKTAFYDKHLTMDHIRIKANELPIFKRETIIDCRKVHPVPRGELKKRFLEAFLRFEGTLPPDKMAHIDQIVAQSRFISFIHKKAILGWL